MRQVRTCDFCSDDPAGVYEPLPSSIPDAPRMLLCDGCRDRLSSVVDPLLARMEGAPDRESGGRTGRAPGDRNATTSSRASDDGSGGDESDLPEGDAETREWPADPRERADEASDRVDERPDESLEATTAADEPGQPTDGPAGDGAITNRPGEPAPDAGDASGETEAPPSSIDDLTDDGGVEVSESRDASGRPQRERGGAPRGYRKVLRFLENRELPMDRAEAERITSEAYELDAGEVGAAIDHAIQYGRLREVSGELRR